MTRLRKMMLEELQRGNYSAITTRNYLRVVTEFARHFGKSPDKLGPNELRTYQAYLLTECKLTPGTVINRVAALRFFFVKTLKRHQFRDFLPYPQDRRRLPAVLSREEVARLIDAAGTLFRRTLLMTLYATGMGRSELAHLKVSDIDSQRMIIRVVQGKGGKDRDRPLSPALLETLREYWRWRKPRLYLSPRAPASTALTSRSPTKPYGLHVAMPHIGLASANASPRIRCATVGRPTCWRRAPIYAPSRFCSDMVIWKRQPSTCICRSGTCRQLTIRWTVSLYPALRTSAAALNEKTKNDSAHLRGGRHSSRAGRSLPGSVSIQLWLSAAPSVSGHSALPHRCTGRSSRCLPELRSSGHLLPLVQKSALPQVPDAGARALVGGS